MSRIANQTGIILDAISAGPIEGLVNGKKSIFLNDASIISGDPLIQVDGVNFDVTPREFLASTTVNQNTIDVPLDTIFTTEELAALRAGTTDVEAYIWIEGAGRTVIGGAMGGIYARKENSAFGTGISRTTRTIFNTLSGRIPDIVQSDEQVNKGRYEGVFHESPASAKCNKWIFS